jgi:AraC-like DNA-binding protein
VHIPIDIKVASTHTEQSLIACGMDDSFAATRCDFSAGIISMAFASYLSKKPVQSISQESRALERHYTVLEIAEMWSLSEKTVRRMFEQEEGVLQWGSQETRRKRGYITLRIPESVLLRVHHKRALRAG